mgnify:CR=1 FL=1
MTGRRVYFISHPNVVVSKDVPDFAVVAGVPARVLRFRFPESVREALLRLSWWDWDHATLAARVPDFRALGAAEFCTKYG